MRLNLGDAFTNGAILSIVRLIFGLIRVKILAGILGVSGIGLFSWLTQYQALGIALVSMSLAVPIINLGRPSVAIGRTDIVGQYIGTAAVLVSINLTMFCALSLLLRAKFTAILGDETEANVALWFVLGAVLFTSFSVTLFEGLAFVINRFDLYVRVGIASSVLDTVIVAAAAWQYGFLGAAAALPLSALGMLVFYLTFLSRDKSAFTIISATRFRRSAVAPMLGYALSMLATVALVQAATTTLRGYVVATAGASSNGALQVPTALSAYLLPFIMTGFWGHLHALAAEHGDVQEVRREFWKSLKVGAALSFVGTAGIAAAAPFIVPIVYSRDFSMANGLVTGYMPAEFAFQVATIMSSYFLVVGQRGVYVLVQLVYAAVMLIAAGFLIPEFGAPGYVAGHGLASLSFLAVAMSIAWRAGQIDGRIVAVVLAGVVAIAALSGIFLFEQMFDFSLFWARAGATVSLGLVGVVLLLRSR